VPEGGRGIKQMKLVSSGNASSGLSYEESFRMEKSTYVDEISKLSGIVVCE